MATKQQQRIDFIRSLLREDGWEEDRYGNMLYTTEDGRQYRYHFKSNVVRLEKKIASLKEWMRIRSFNIINVAKLDIAIWTKERVS